jgi:hypothetical protein
MWEVDPLLSKVVPVHTVNVDSLEVKLHVFLTSARHGSERGCFTPKEIISGKKKFKFTLEQALRVQMGNIIVLIL